jgi:carboxyl-terminal processing protease
LYEKDSIKVADSLKFKTKNGRIVFGGGGIVPDLFVPMEINHAEGGIEILMQSGLVSFFVFEKLDENRRKYEKINQQTLDVYLKEKDFYFNDFQKYVQKSGFVFSLENHQAFAKKYLKAEFYKQVFNDEKYFELILPEDPMIQAVKKEIGK